MKHEIINRIRDEDIIAMDAESKREFDENGYMHVAASNLTREQVAPYFGYEIPKWKELGLERERIYYGYRKSEEIQKSMATFNGVPLLYVHKMDSANNPLKQERVGAIGTNAAWDAPFLKNSLVIWDKEAIDSVLDGSLKDLSCGYRYKADFKSGKTDDGVAYDFVMTDIRCNHVALVAEGRAPECYVEDELPDPLKGLIMEEEKKVEGQDSMAEALKEVVAKYVSDPEQVNALLAELADLQKAHHAEEEAQSEAALAAKDEGASDEDKPAEEAKDECAAKDENPEAVAKDEDKPEEKTEEKPAEAKDEAPADEPKPEEAKPAEPADAEKKDEGAMDKNAIAESVRSQVVAQFRAADAVRGAIGSIDAMAFDSAEAIYMEACKQMGVTSVSLETAKDVFLAVSAMKGKTESIAMDAKSNGANPALKLLHR